MLTLLERLSSDQVFDFHGGIHPPEYKSLSNNKPIGKLPLAEELVVPLRQHLGEMGEVLVKANDRVLKGQPLSKALSVMGVPVHAPTSGTVISIENRPLTHASGLWDKAVVIKPDGQNQWAEKHPINAPFEADPAELLKALKNAGLSGMGGAGFPTGVKLGSGRTIDALVINAAECEPYITSDDCLLREEPENVVAGARLMARIVGAQTVVIGIEDNKPEAISALEAVIEGLDDVTMKVVPTKYPSGAEKQLIKLLAGEEVPAGGIPADLGLVVQNVGTAYAAYRAIVLGEPLIKRVVTVTGQQVAKPGNYWLPIGTPIRHVLAACGFKAEKKQRLIIGGPMMGFTLNDPAAPVTKTVNCLLLPNKKELKPAGREMNCIRCGECAEVCPAELLPQQLYWYAKAQDADKLEEYKLSACIECGACAFVCPSQIPLVQYYRVAKAEIRSAQEDARKSDKARERFEARKERLERDKAEREARHQEATERRKAAMAERSEQPKANDAVAAALARVKAQKDADIAKAQQTAEAGAHLEKGQLLPDNSEMARLREERKRQAREKKAQQPEATAEDKASAVAAAIARAKAKKAATESDTAADSVNAETKAPAPDDAKKAAVAAAIARAKAKKAAANGQASDDTSATPDAAPADNTAVEAAPETEADRKKAAIAAAIARAKAKKAAANGQASSDTQDAAPADSTAVEDTQPEAAPATEADRKKAAVAAAIARAKAKKAAANGQASSDTPDAAPADDSAVEDTQPAAAPATEADRKKAAVAAAIARAKAKKAAAKGQTSSDTASATPDAAPADNTAVADTQPAAAPETEAERKKAAVAKAIALAKAKKKAQEGQD
ncbi:electron transport complex subunit RsxC [Gallaecimonas mangrovi]|uniref:electron transport complex subunit RsxC n=1 Tax=Gallaecimonas mangrovi TaxID=2291597 RepID=UPI000E20726B|nr:electron transport complex subunit RsxC [Gallaecimonas mangrovi]